MGFFYIMLRGVRGASRPREKWGGFGGGIPPTRLFDFCGGHSPPAPPVTWYGLASRRGV